MSEAIKACELLQNKNIRCSVYSVPCIKPIDDKKIIELSKKSKLLITMEEHNIIGGLGSSVAEVISQTPSHAPLIRFGLKMSLRLLLEIRVICVKCTILMLNQFVK